MTLDKVIFLDIDGVLATDHQFMMDRNKFHQKNPIAKELKIPYPFDPKCVAVFNQILEESGAEIVLSSDWRIPWSLSDLDQIFKFNKVSKSPIAKTTSQRFSMRNLELNRVEQIQEFLSQNEVGSYVVIDDLHMDFYGLKNFVKTEDTEGIKKSGLKSKILYVLSNNETTD